MMSGGGQRTALRAPGSSFGGPSRTLTTPAERRIYPAMCVPYEAAEPARTSDTLHTGSEAPGRSESA